MYRIGLAASLLLSCAPFAPVSSAYAALDESAQIIPGVAGRVDAVTVYRGQALVTRVVELDQGPGLHELLITDLPARIVPGSLHAEGSRGVVVRSVRYRERPVREDVRAEVESLRKQLAAKRDELTRVSRRLETLAQQQAYLDRLDQFTAGTAAADLSRGVLNAGTLREMSDYIFAQRDAIQEQSLELQFEKRRLDEEIAHLTREQAVVGERSTRTAREAVVIVEAPEAGAAIQLHYLVSRANWTPSYTVRGDVAQQTAVVEYFASIEQTSGEDWGGVTMTLSTATPSLVARAPRLTALPIALQPAGGRTAQPGQSRADLRDQQRSADHARRMAAPSGGEFGDGGTGGAKLHDADMHLNVYADQLQIQEFAGQVVSDLAFASDSNEGHSVTYLVAGRTSLPSRSERQLVQIAAMPVDGEFYMVAIPVLTSYVYEEALVSNESNYVLLAGPVSTYANGQFVGHSEFDDIPVGETLQIGFGINSSLRSDRQLVKQDGRVQGGNRVVDLTYRLSVQNFGGEPTVVRLMDRLPLVKPNEIQLTVLDDGAETESGVLSTSHDAEAGILQWDVSVPARNAGAGVVTVEYTIRLEYDRQMIVAGLAQ